MCRSLYLNTCEKLKCESVKLHISCIVKLQAYSIIYYVCTSYGDTPLH